MNREFVCKDCVFCIQETHDGYAKCKLHDNCLIKLESEACDDQILLGKVYQDSFGYTYRYDPVQQVFVQEQVSGKVLSSEYRNVLTMLNQ